MSSSSQMSFADADASATEEDRKAIRRNYRDILEGMADAELEDVALASKVPCGDDEDDEEAALQSQLASHGADFDETARRASKLFHHVHEPTEALLDARVMHILSRKCRRRAEALSANTARFRREEFADKLVKAVGGVSSTEGGAGGAAYVAPDRWSELGRAVSFLFPRAPFLGYVHGSIEVEEVAKKTRQKRASTQIVDRPLIVTKATQLSQEEAEGDQDKLTEARVQHVFRQLVRCYKSNDKRPICYFGFVIDPDSFGATVENVFHVSFLVKEGKAKVSVDPVRGLPVIQPHKPSARTQEGDGEQEEDAAAKKQTVVNLCVRDWEALKEALDIRHAAIKSNDGGSKRAR